jgi:hypothetical protein
MKKYSKILSLIATFILSGCVGSMPKYNTSSSTFIVFKTPTLRYADQGFISKANSETKVEIYSSGKAVMRLRVTNNQICLSSLACMSGNEFNKKVLNANYPSDTLGKIFRGEPIFGGKNLIKTKKGFKQKIGSISYSVEGKNIEFIDTIAGVKIKVKYME